MFKTVFFQNSFSFWDNVEKYDRIGQATDNNTARAFGLLNNSGYRHTLRIYVMKTMVI